METSSDTARASHVYPYQSLTERGGIRLFVLEPSGLKDAGLKDDETLLSGSLIHTTLSDCSYDLIVHFSALSYVWGDATGNKLISIDGYHVKVTANVYAALSDIQEAARPVRLWVDALCINQFDTQEKNTQVAMMGDIYATADHTIIYLGSADAAEDFSTLRDVLKLEMQTQKSICFARASNITLGVSLANSILKREWFFRAWVFQELVMSRDPWVQVGKDRIPWRAMHDVLTNSGERRNSIGNLEPSGDLLQSRDHIRQMHLARQRFITGHDSQRTMFDLLSARRGVGVSNPSDIIYAHCGIASDGHNIIVDYAKPYTKLYEEFTAYQLRKTLDYAVLCIAEDHFPCKRPNRMASWAVNWRSTAPAPLQCGRWPRKVEKSIPIYTSWPSQTQEESSETESAILACIGVRIATVVHTSKPIHGSGIESSKQDDFSTRLSTLRTSCTTASSIESFPPLRDLYVEIYNAWSSLVDDNTILPPLSLNEGTLSQGSYIQRELLKLRRLRFIADRLMRAKTLYYDSGPYQQYRAATTDILVQYFLDTFDKRIVDGRILAQTTTDEATCLVLAPSTTKIGDIFAFLPHASE